MAKVASDAEKPDGFVVLSAEQARERFAGSPPGLVPGIGPKTAERLERQGIATLGRARGDAGGAAGRAGSAPGSGPGWAGWPASRTTAGSRPCAWPSPSRARPPSTSDLRGLGELEPQLRRLTEQLCATLERQQTRGRTIGIKVRYDDFSTVTRARSLAAPVNELDTVWAVALDLLRRLDPPRPVRLIGVRVAGLDEERARSLAPADQLTLSL